MRLAGLPGGVVELNHRKLPAGIGLVTRLENRLAGLDKLRLEQQAIIDRQRQEITRAQSAIGAPFPQQDALLAAKKALDDLVKELRKDTGAKTRGGPDPRHPQPGRPSPRTRTAATSALPPEPGRPGPAATPAQAQPRHQTRPATRTARPAPCGLPHYPGRATAPERTGPRASFLGRHRHPAAGSVADSTVARWHARTP